MYATSTCKKKYVRIDTPVGVSFSFHFRRTSNAHTDPYTKIFFKLIVFKLDVLVLHSCVFFLGGGWGEIKVNMFQISYTFTLKHLLTHMYTNFVYTMNHHSSWKHSLISFCLNAFIFTIPSHRDKDWAYHNEMTK